MKNFSIFFFFAQKETVKKKKKFLIGKKKNKKEKIKKEKRKKKKVPLGVDRRKSYAVDRRTARSFTSAVPLIRSRSSSPANKYNGVTTIDAAVSAGDGLMRFLISGPSSAVRVPSSCGLLLKLRARLRGRESSKQ